MNASVKGEGPTFVADQSCLVAGDEYGFLQLRCYAAGLSSDLEIRTRVLQHLDGMIEPRRIVHRDDAAVAIALHAVIVGLPARRTAQILARLSIILPGGVTDPAEIAAIDRLACAEFSA